MVVKTRKRTYPHRYTGVILIVFGSELARAAEPHIKKEDESKYRCKPCNKLFKGVTFVEKHIANKHPELTASVLDAVSSTMVAYTFMLSD